MRQLILQSKLPSLSMEVFPPKRDEDMAGIYHTLEELKDLHPEFISVTYGAGGTTSKKTVSIASFIQNQLQVPSIAHLTCAALDDFGLTQILEQLKQEGILNILALRGDKPKEMTKEDFAKRHYRYAMDMITDIHKQGDFYLGAACYPEKHVEASTLEADINNLRCKIDCGVDFLITQLFFENEAFYRFRECTDKAGIHIPILAGIMPVTSASQLGTTVTLSGAGIPQKLSDLLAHYGTQAEDMKKAGTEYAIRQIEDLKKHGIDGIHLYTMNRAKICREIAEETGLLNTR